MRMAMAVMQSRMNITTAITPRRRKEKKVKRKDRQIITHGPESRRKKEWLRHIMQGVAEKPEK